MTKQETIADIAEALNRIARGIEVLAGTGDAPEVVLEDADAYHWDSSRNGLIAVPKVNRVPLSLLQGIDSVAETLLNNTRQFAQGHGANNALLWGARGMGKSSLVKAVHAEIIEKKLGASRLILIEINREDIATLPVLMRALADRPERFIIFCDDLSFSNDETIYKSLKTILDGGLEGRAENALFYATSNRRHLMPRDMIENERSTAINPSEAVQEKVSLSDRFGLWLGFHGCDQPTYLEMVRRYTEHYGIKIDDSDRDAQAIEWAALRGSRSGRVAIQFIRHIAGERGVAV
jgi:predicted AAA+ superfamily ATPase